MSVKINKKLLIRNVYINQEQLSFSAMKSIPYVIKKTFFK